MMRLRMFDIATNEPAGEFEIPDAIAEAARKVSHWMRENNATELYGLRCMDNQPAGKYLGFGLRGYK